MRIAVVGSRKFKRIGDVHQFISEQPSDTVIISGGALGVDQAVIHAAKLSGLTHEVYYADWRLHGKSAGVIRNHVMVDAADQIVAFWDGESKGTKHTIDYARRRRKPCRVIEETRL